MGEFKQLATWAEGDPTRLEAVKKMLKLTKGWEEARDHAAKVRGSGGACVLAWWPSARRPEPPASAPPAPSPPLPPLPPQAVTTDNRLRCFFTDDSRKAGLLFACEGANPRLAAPIGALRPPLPRLAWRTGGAAGCC